MLGAILFDLDTLVDARDHRPVPGALELVATIRARGLRVGLAASSVMVPLAERTTGTRLHDHFDAIVDLTETSTKLGAGAAECALIGATADAAKAAVRAGLVMIGLTTAGDSQRALRQAGARVVYRDPAELLARLDDVLHRASPSRRRLDPALLSELMGHALEAARDALAHGEAPIGCAIADGDGDLVATGYNRFVATGDRIAHAEIAALHAAGARLPERDAILVSTLEPCVMCLGAAMEIAIDTVVYAARAPADSGTGRVQPPESPDNQMPRIVGGIHRDEALALFREWLASPHDARQEPYIRSVLAQTA